MAPNDKKIESLEDLMSHLTDPNEKNLQFSEKAVEVKPQTIPPKPTNLTPPNPNIKPAIQNQAVPGSGPKTAYSSLPLSNGTLNSLIRTMNGDLDALQRGQKPQGLEVKRTISGVSITEPAQNVQDPAKTGKGQEVSKDATKQKYEPEIKAKGRFLGIIPRRGGLREAPGSYSGGSQTGDGSSGGRGLFSFKINKRAIIIILTGLVLTGGAYATFTLVINKEPEAEYVTFTPRPSKAPVKNNLDSIFTSISGVEYKITDKNDINDLYSFINSQTIKELKFKKINFVFSDNQSKKPTLPDIFKSFSISYPNQPANIINGDFKVLIHGQKEVFGQSVPASVDEVAREKRIMIIVEVANLSSASQILSEWEKTMSNDLASILKIDTLKGVNFSNNTYKEVKIRFNNFNLPDKSLDYAIVPALNKKNYLVISNSRESMYVTIDILKGQ